MVEAHTADIVLSLTGRDKGRLMLVMAEEGGFSSAGKRARAQSGKSQAQAPQACELPGAE